jgi:hypothetical protein
MSRIEIKISPTVTQEQRQDPRFVKLFENDEASFNCSCAKHARVKSLISLHEGAHAYFAKKVGLTGIKFYGPTMHWDSRPKYDCPAMSRSSVSWKEPNGFDVVVAKACLGGFICRREMTDSPNDAVAIEKDLARCRVRFDKHIGGGDEAFKLFVADAERLLLEDLKSPSVKDEIWAEAKRFEKEIFPAPKLTSGLLRARRLGLDCTAKTQDW